MSVTEELMSIDEPITKLFSSFIKSFEEESQLRENIKKITKEIDGLR